GHHKLNSSDSNRKCGNKPDIALISVHLQDGLFSGFARLQEISHQFPNLPWVLLLDRTEPQLVVDAFRAGARGVFSCSESETKLLGKCVRSEERRVGKEC